MHRGNHRAMSAGTREPTGGRCIGETIGLGVQDPQLENPLAADAQEAIG